MALALYRSTATKQDQRTQDGLAAQTYPKELLIVVRCEQARNI
jgi:hypothetical protein